MEVAFDWLVARGHPNVRASHRTTLEITKDEWLTVRGNCIIGVASSKAAADLDERLKRVLSSDDAVVVVVLSTSSACDVVVARGSSALAFTDSRKLIVRRSGYVDGATLAIRADKAAIDLRRDLVEDLRRGDTLKVVVIALRPSF